MAVDRALVKETFLQAVRQSRQDVDFMEECVGRYLLYRLMFEYPKKWSKRKVKKIGSKEMQFFRIDYGLEKGVEAVENLGPEYEELLSKELL
jgi:hypothetical protein